MNERNRIEPVSLQMAEGDRARIESALGEIPLQVRAALDLSIRHRYSPAEIADIAGVEEATVVAWREDALAAIASELGVSGPEAGAQAAERLERMLGESAPNGGSKGTAERKAEVEVEEAGDDAPGGGAENEGEGPAAGGDEVEGEGVAADGGDEVEVDRSDQVEAEDEGDADGIEDEAAGEEAAEDAGQGDHVVPAEGEGDGVAEAGDHADSEAASKGGAGAQGDADAVAAAGPEDERDSEAEGDDGSQGENGGESQRMAAGETAAAGAAIAAGPGDGREAQPEGQGASSAAVQGAGPADRAGARGDGSRPAAAEPAGRSGRRWIVGVVLLIAVAVALVLILTGGPDQGAGSAAGSGEGTGSQPPSKATGGGEPTPGPVRSKLKRLAGTAGKGTAEAKVVETANSRQRLELTLSGLPRGDDRYTAWLYTTIIDSRALGSISTGSGRIKALLPANSGRYKFLDISIQRPGSKTHSGRSVFRVRLGKLLGAG